MTRRSFPPERSFMSLSVRDLLEARDYYHPALANMENVVATAVGKYRFRPRDADHMTKRMKGGIASRTLFNSRLRKSSFPCLLVFVKEWISLAEFDNPGTRLRERVNAEEAQRNIVPQFLYLSDGRPVPTCVVQVDMAPRESRSLPWIDIRFPDHLFGGGYGITAEVQGSEHVGTVSCLVTDGERLYALTARHVAGPPGQEVCIRFRGEEHVIGESSQNQLRNADFSELYPGWPGRRSVSVLDAGMVCLRDAEQWTSQVFGIGELGTLVDLNTSNISLDLIGYPARSFGARSHERMVGEIFGLFPRFKSIGGVDYVADVLIGPRSGEVSEFRVEPGDSGSLWVVDDEGADEDDQGTGEVDGRKYRPFAVTWAAMDFEGGEQPYQLALASFLSTICQRLDVEVVTEHRVGYQPVWGLTNHRHIAEMARELLGSRSKLGKLLRGRNSSRADDLVYLATIPDLWKRPPYSRGKEGPNHYANLDLVSDNGFSLGEIALDPGEWRDLYATADPGNRGALPFRVWQVFDEMCDMFSGGVNAAGLRRFFCACGVLAHYIADACNPAHVTRWGLGGGDWSKHYIKSFHSLWDNPMITESLVRAEFDSSRVSSAITRGSTAGRRTLELMLYTLAAIPVGDFVEPYGSDAKGGRDAARDYTESDEGQAQLADVVARGCELLLSLWKSAWRCSGGGAASTSRILSWSTAPIEDLCHEREFLESLSLKDMEIVDDRVVAQ